MAVFHESSTQYFWSFLHCEPLNLGDGFSTQDSVETSRLRLESATRPLLFDLCGFRQTAFVDLSSIFVLGVELLGLLMLTY